MRHSLLVFLIVSFGLTSALAQVAPPSEASADIAEMDTIVVSGEQPGPGLWKVSKGDHVLYVLGTLAPLPKGMSWKANEVVEVIAMAQEVLGTPQVGIKADVGFFGQLALLPSLIGVRKNPDDKTLKDVVPAELYARWSVLKEKYIGRSS